MKYIAALLLIVINIINIPLSMLFGVTQKWYLSQYKKDKVLFFAFAPFYWILVILNAIFSWTSEQLVGYAH